MLKAYRDHVAERAALGIPPLPLSAKQTGEVIELLKAPPAGEEAFLVDLITHRVPAGVDDAAKVKASYLAAVAHGTEKCALISRERATELLEEGKKLQSLDAAFRWALAQDPRVVPDDVVIQDEYIHDVLFRVSDTCYLVFDTS